MKNQLGLRVFALMPCLILLVLAASPQPAAAQPDDFPQSNAWYRATPSVVWCDDPDSTTTLEVHIVGRTDVGRVWITDLGTDEEEGRAELFDDATHGDAAAGDNVFTLSEVVLPCNPLSEVLSPGYDNWWGMLRVMLKDGTQLGNNYGMAAGMVDPKYKNAFEVQDFGDGLSATAYAFFIQDTDHEVINSYPVSDVYCGKSNFEGYKKFYSVMPDAFDFAVLMPGMQIFRPAGLGENVPYHVTVSNTVENIGASLFDNTAAFGSAGRLRSAIYNSFGSIDVLDHEIGHSWMAGVGQNLGLMHETNPTIEKGHWNEMTDIQGQMGSYFFDGSGAVGHFAYNGDETWRLVSNFTVEPYSPLELYLMGLIPPEEVPDIHILYNPDLTDPEHITAESYKTVTIEQVMASAGGERVPSYIDSQKEFNIALIITQDLPYNDAAYAFFSLLAHRISSVEGPTRYSSYAPFYWAAGGRGTINARLPLSLAAPDYIPGDPTPTAAPTATNEATPEPTAANTQAPTSTIIPQPDEPDPTLAPTVAEEPQQETPGPWLWGSIIGGAVVGAAVLIAIFLRKRP